MGSCGAVCWPRGGELGDAKRCIRRCPEPVGTPGAATALRSARGRVRRAAQADRTLLPPDIVTSNLKALFAPRIAMAREMRHARSACASGDIFTPALQVYFRTLIAETLRDEGITDLLTIVEDENAVHTPARVNGDYPAGRSPRADWPPIQIRGRPLQQLGRVGPEVGRHAREQRIPGHVECCHRGVVAAIDGHCTIELAPRAGRKVDRAKNPFNPNHDFLRMHREECDVVASRTSATFIPAAATGRALVCAVLRGRAGLGSGDFFALLRTISERAVTGSISSMQGPDIWMAHHLPRLSRHGEAHAIC